MSVRPDILAPESDATLRRFCQSRVLLAFDFDGVLAPIVETPERARLRAGTRRLLTQVAGRYPCVVLSGRRLDDLAPRLIGIPLRQVIGNFGHEPAPRGRRPPPMVQAWLAALEARLGDEPGVRFEDKGYSLAVHYRHAPDRERARRVIRAVVARLAGARVLNGTLATTLLPAAGPDKGVALHSARRRFRCDHALYVGDDGTDEDALGSAPADRLLSIRVGPGQTRARFRLSSQHDIDELLRRVLALRAMPPRHGATPPDP